MYRQNGICNVIELVDFMTEKWGLVKCKLLLPNTIVEFNSLEEMPERFYPYAVCGFTYNDVTNSLSIRCKERLYGTEETQKH